MNKERAIHEILTDIIPIWLMSFAIAIFLYLIVFTIRFWEDLIL